MAKVVDKNLDYDGVKESIKEFFKERTEFTDYNFEGSAMSQLINVLAYMATSEFTYINFMLNESFLDTASKRESISSLAKMLGYTPSSPSCAKAEIAFSVRSEVDGDENVTLPKNTAFNAKINDTTFKFYTTSEVSASSSDLRNWDFGNISITEGTPVTETFTFDGSKIIVSNRNIDTKTLKVTVKEDSSSTETETYAFSDTISDVENDSKVYFLKENYDGKYEVEFGNGTIGKKLENGNVVTLEYFVSSLSLPNGAKNFTYAGSNIAGITNQIVTISTVTSATGGNEKEEKETIRFNAPKQYSSQNRAITNNDYIVQLKTIYDNIKSISVWGGEDNIPRAPGKIFFCIQPKDGEKVSEHEKERIKNEIKKKSSMTVIHEIVDSEYVYVDVNTTVYFDGSSTTYSEKDIETLVKNAIVDFNNTNLDKFDGIFRYSNLIKKIDESDESIKNNSTRISIRKTLKPIFNKKTTYNINLYNPIDNSLEGKNVYSSVFKIYGSNNDYYLSDTKNDGILRLILKEKDNEVEVKTSGSIDYSKGIITITDLNVKSISGSNLTIHIKPTSYDVSPSLNNILQIDSDKIKIKVINDKTISGNLGSGLNYNHSAI